MLTSPDPRRLHYRHHRPLPDREGILSPRLTFHSRRGIAGGNYPWMENRHPSACFARRPELEPSQSAGGLRVVWHGIVRDRNNLPLPLPHREGKKHPIVSTRMLGPCGITVQWHGTVHDGRNLPLPLPHREGKNRPIVSARMLGPCGVTVQWHGIVRDRNNLPLPLPHREGKKRHSRPTLHLRRGIAGGYYLRMENRHPSACFARRPELEPSQSAGFFHNNAAGEASGNNVHLLPIISARMLRPYEITGQWHATVHDAGNPPQPLPHREGK